MSIIDTGLNKSDFLYCFSMIFIGVVAAIVFDMPVYRASTCIILGFVTGIALDVRRISRKLDNKKD